MEAGRFFKFSEEMKKSEWMLSKKNLEKQSTMWKGSSPGNDSNVRNPS
jgi:hypothetical protein